MYFPCIYFEYQWLAFTCFEVMGWLAGMAGLAVELITEFPVVVFVLFLVVITAVQYRKGKGESRA